MTAYFIKCSNTDRERVIPIRPFTEDEVRIALRGDFEIETVMSDDLLFLRHDNRTADAGPRNQYASFLLGWTVFGDALLCDPLDFDT